MASAHEDAGENEAEVPPAHELLRIADVAGNAGVAAALTAANDAADATAAGAGEADADARAAALPYGRGVLPDGEDEVDAPPVQARRSVSNGAALAILEFAAAALKSKVANGALAGSDAPDIIEA